MSESCAASTAGPDAVFSVEEVAEILESATRIGADRDVPEGSRTIEISDTLARQMAKALRQCGHRTSPHEIPLSRR